MAKHLPTVPDNYIEVFEKLRAGVVFTDNKNRIIHANTFFLDLYRLRHKDILGKACGEILHPDDVDYTQFNPDHASYKIELKIDGIDHCFLVTNSDMGNDIMVKLIQDITKIFAELSGLKKEIRRLSHLVENSIGNSPAIPMCCECHRIRLKDDSWVTPRDHEELTAHGITHGFCPECARKYFAELNIGKGPRDTGPSDTH